MTVIDLGSMGTITSVCEDQYFAWCRIKGDKSAGAPSRRFLGAEIKPLALPTFTTISLANNVDSGSAKLAPATVLRGHDA